jgi:hypothetical protein
MGDRRSVEHRSLLALAQFQYLKVLEGTGELACSQLGLHTEWGLRQESRLAMDSGKSLGKLSLWAGLSGCRLTSAEACC